MAGHTRFGGREPGRASLRRTTAAIWGGSFTASPFPREVRGYPGRRRSRARDGPRRVIALLVIRTACVAFAVRAVAPALIALATVQALDPALDPLDVVRVGVPEEVAILDGGE